MCIIFCVLVLAGLGGLAGEDEVAVAVLVGAGAGGLLEALALSVPLERKENRPFLTDLGAADAVEADAADVVLWYC